MADSVAGAAAWLGGTEIVNDSRTIAYMQNGIKPSTLTVSGDCGCEHVLQLAGCDDEYVTPEKDNAPWYDPDIPESAEFAGFLTTEFEGLGSTFARTVSESIGDGATLGRSRFGSRTLSWKGLLFGSSCCGVAYGLRWLGRTLQGSKNCGNNCYGDDLELLVCCPTMEAALGLGPDLICSGDFSSSTGFFAPSGYTSITWDNILVYSGSGAMRAINPVDGEDNRITFSVGGPDSGCLIPVTRSRPYKLSLWINETLLFPEWDSDSEGYNVDDVVFHFGSYYRKNTLTPTENEEPPSDSWDLRPPEVLEIIFRWYDKLNDEMLTTTTTTSQNLTNDGLWHLRETTVIPPVDAVSVRIDFKIGNTTSLSSKDYFIDEVKLNQLNYAPVVDAFRTLKNVSLIEGPTVQGQRKMGSTCGGKCGGSTTMEIEFSLVGAQPWLYSAPIPVVNCVDVQSNAVSIIGGVPSGFITNNPLGAGVTTNVTSAGFADLPLVNLPNNIYLTLDPGGTLSKREVVLVTAHAVGSTTVTIARAQQGTTDVSHPINTPWIMQTECGSNNCAHGLLAQAPGYEGCAPPVLPPSAIYVGCATPDTNNWKAVYITAPRAMWNSISEVVPVITINTGGLHLIGARIGFYTSADGNPCGDLINTPPQCDLICDSLYISAIPGNSKFYIDGRTNKMSLVCGTNSVFPGEPYTLGPFSWPSFDCYGFCMEFAYDPQYESGGLCVSLSLVPRTTL